eukprot:gene7193-7999_t
MAVGTSKQKVVRGTEQMAVGTSEQKVVRATEQMAVGTSEQKVVRWNIEAVGSWNFEAYGNWNFNRSTWHQQSSTAVGRNTSSLQLQLHWWMDECKKGASSPSSQQQRGMPKT